MRRKIGYCLLTGSLILAGAALLGPTVVGLDTDLTYGSGRDLVFKISEADTTYDGVKTENYVKSDDPDAVKLVSEEFEARLKTWGVEAEVVKEGYDTIRVKIRSPQDDDTEYRYIENYLSFSGGSFTFGASIDNTEDYEKIRSDKWSDAFKDQTARIEYVSTSGGDVPAVVVPLRDSDDIRGTEGSFNTLVKYCTDNTVEANESSSIEAKNCYLVLWANKQEGDTYEKANSSSSNYDANVNKRLIFAEHAAQAWFEEDNEDDEYTEFQMIPSSAAITSEGYDSSKAGAAYKAAFFYMNILNASSYKDLGVNGYDVTFAFETKVSATAESLLNFGSWNVHPNFGATFIATIVTLGFSAVILVSLYRMGSLAILSNVAVAILGSLLLFSYFGAQFGVGALIGLALAALITAFGGMYYFSKVKEQLYQGRSLKKSHEEAIKRALWPTIDAGIIGIIIGLCVYGFIPSVVGKMGLTLILGSFFGTLSNLLLLRLEGYLLANDSDVEKNVGKLYNVKAEKIPNLAKEEKPSYFGAFASKDFGKHSKPIAIVSSILLVASIIGISVFTAVNGGNAYNYANAYNDTTISYVEYRVSEGSFLPLSDEADLEDKVLANIYTVTTENNESKETKIAYSDVNLESSSVYYTQEEKKLNVHYFSVEWSDHYNVEENYDFILKFNGVETKINTTLNTALSEAVHNFIAEDSVHITTDNVVVQAGQPTTATLWLGLGVGLLISMAYMAIRYKLSRGIATGLLATGVSLITLGFFSLTRIVATPLIAMSAIAGGLIVFLLAIFILAKEKELAKDSREKDKDSLSFKALCLTNANSQAAESVIGFSFLSAFAFIWYMGFMPSTWMMVFLGIIIAVIIAAVIVLTLLTPSSIYLAKGLSRVNISLKPKKKETFTPTGSGHRKKGEPEEAIFIGIND